MTLSIDQLETIISELVTRPKHEKVRALLHKLLTDGLGAPSRDVTFEEQTKIDVRGRIDALLGRTVIEIKSDLRNEKFETQLTGYLKDKRSQTGQEFVGIVTDGALFSVHELNIVGDGLEKIGEYRPSIDQPEKLLPWLESVVALQDRLSPEVERIKLELGRESVLYQRAMRELRLLWDQVGNDPEVMVKRQLWDRLLRVAYGSEIEAPELFLQHTYLVIVAKAVATAAFVDHLPTTGQDLLDGKEFRDLGIVGAVEADFFDWLLKAPEGDDLVLRIARQAARFDLSAIEIDVLKGLYESLIDPAQRHELGEYYTPDWLAARIVAEVIDKPLEQRVIDPACGSGTFLFHAVRRLAAAGREAKMEPGAIVSLAAEKIAGIDIHPVAVIFARATWLLAVAPTLIQGRPGRFALPVYLGDALQWHGGDLASEDFEIVVPAVEGYDGKDAQFGRKILRFPGKAATNPDLLDQLLQQMLNLAERDRAVGEFLQWLSSDGRLPSVDFKLLAKTYETLALLHSQGRNHIWGYIARNMSRPVWLAAEAQKADVVVGNPPWVAYSRMERGLKEIFKKAMRQVGIWGGTGSVSGFDLSAYFFVRSMQLYMKRDGRIAFVIPQASMFKQPYAPFRKGRFRLAGFATFMKVDKAWQFSSKVQPLFPVPASVWFARFANLTTALPDSVTAFEGHLPRRDANLEEASAALAEFKADWPAEDTGRGGSEYRAAFRAGALLYPRRFVMVERLTAGRLPENPHAPRVRGRVGKQDKKPWKEIEPPQGPIEIGFLKHAYLGENIYPYRVGEPLEAVVPVARGTMLNSKSAMTGGQPHLAAWLEACESLWKDNGQDTRLLADHLNYFEQLTCQFPIAPLRVVYAKSGTQPAAALLRDSKAVLDHFLYWMPCATDIEGRYLCAILNSETARSRVEKFQAEGQWGKRHFDKAMFNLPIPVFNASKSLHAKLATAAAEAERAASFVEVREGEYFVTTRNRIRKTLIEDGIAGEIDKLVEKLLGPV
jgi:SAM-dependent methyltransferase